MKLNVLKNRNVVIVYLNGRIDVHLSKIIEEEACILIDAESANHFIFDFQRVEYISSSGLTMLLSIMTKLKKDRKTFVLCNLSSSVKKILELVEMTSIFNIYKNEKEAVESLNTQRMVS